MSKAKNLVLLILLLAGIWFFGCVSSAEKAKFVGCWERNITGTSKETLNIESDGRAVLGLLIGSWDAVDKDTIRMNVHSPINTEFVEDATYSNTAGESLYVKGTGAYDVTFYRCD